MHVSAPIQPPTVSRRRVILATLAAAATIATAKTARDRYAPAQEPTYRRPQPTPTADPATSLHRGLGAARAPQEPP